MRIRRLVLITVSLLCLTGCGEVSKTVLPPPAPEAKPAEDAPPPPPIPLDPAPKAQASLSFLSGGDRGCETAQPARKMEEVEAASLGIGMIPTAIPPRLANQLTAKTRVWKVDSPDFDFYKILSGGRPGGLRPDKPALGCIRYQMNDETEMVFSVRYNPKSPEILSIAPVRIHYRDFASLSAHSGARQAAFKASLSLRTYSLDRNSGRLTTNLKNEEMAVGILADPGTGAAIDRIFDPSTAPAAKIPLPPWDYSSADETPRHNLSVLEITVTEIADFDWLQSQILTLWPGWEYEATDVAKLKHSAEFYRGSQVKNQPHPE